MIVSQFPGAVEVGNLKPCSNTLPKSIELLRTKREWAILYVFTILIDLVTVFDAILTSRQTCEKLQCLYENLMSNNFRKTAVLKKISIAN